MIFKKEIIRALVPVFFVVVGFSPLLAEDGPVQNGKQGWGFGVLPAISFDADLGFQYGGLVNFFHYGDGSRFPDYDHSLYFEISRYTGGSGVFRFYYDSDRLFEGLRVTTDLTYMPEQAYDFYGFNGYESVFNKSWEDDGSADYRSRMFYKMQHNLFRFKTDVQGAIGDGNFRWIAGVNLLNFDIGSVDIDRLNRRRSDEDQLPSLEEQPGLYERYLDWGIIPEKHSTGGFVPEIKAGVVFDSRDNRPNPMRGVWTEAVVLVAPEFLGATTGFSKLAITHRQYFTIIPEDLSFACRLGWQHTILGDVPWYYQSQIITSVMAGSTSTGLGGVRSLRGIRRNRVVGDGMVFGNFELRWKPLYFSLLNQQFYLGVNSFLDAGRSTSKVDVKSHISGIDAPIDDYFDFGAEALHVSYGLGIRVVMNRNFIIAVDYGRAVNEQDGDSGFYVGLNYLF
ncbi:Omp85 family outer membrane protein [Natronoflexus pectinivorans]|uniref:Surface antigen-like protein n=1 Tax=Natronoflexus pectinivorans TaxID=682526 RepID=A0A4R2GMB1_9BACT|nr:BamA/TamA family outer membrane protein [Natronoflexus pectinivorans]TCO09848.1 surface antigen-like protein [Natronoflexus pectinivorans]